MTEDLRALLRAELGAQRPPPLGDVVGAAMREGRRIRRNRRLRILSAGLAAAMVAAAGVVTQQSRQLADRPDPGIPAAAAVPGAADPLPPGNVPEAVPAPTATRVARTLTLHSGTVRADGTRTKATSAAMLHLLTQLLPPGRTSHYEVAPDDDLRVQLYLDDGGGPGMVRVEVGKNPPVVDEPPRSGSVSVTISHMPDNCVQTTTVDAMWPDGTLVRVDVATCLTRDGANEPTRAALTADQAVRVATDPRWGVTMDRQLVATGAKRFPGVPVFG